MNADRFVAKCRQWFFPRQFRIELHEREDWTVALFDLLSNGAATEPAKTPSTEEGAIDSEFAAKLCNSLHELKGNFPGMEEKGTPQRDLKRLKKGVERVDEALKRKRIEYLDLTGEPWYPGREDFESLGSAEEVEKLTRTEIILCERPAVFLSGRLIQKARGLVGVPLRQKQQET